MVATVCYWYESSDWNSIIIQFNSINLDCPHMLYKKPEPDHQTINNSRKQTLARELMVGR